MAFLDHRRAFRSFDAAVGHLERAAEAATQTGDTFLLRLIHEARDRANEGAVYHRTAVRALLKRGA